MSESSNINTIYDFAQEFSNMNINTTSESSSENPIDINDEFSSMNINTMPLDYDFVFELTSNAKNKMRQAISALKNAEFNPSKMGLMQVTKSGFSITVKSKIDPTNDKDYVFGYLRMRAENLVYFECQNPMTKVVPLRDVLRVLKAADFDSGVLIYGVHGFNQLSFDFDYNSDGRILDRSSHVNLIDDINSEYVMFPNVLYGFKEMTSAASLSNLVRDILSRSNNPSNDSVKLDIWTTGVKMTVGEGTHYCKLQQTSKAYNVWWKWRHWWSLSKALCMADVGCIYLVKVPAQSVMLRLKLDELGDVVYLHNAQFEEETQRLLPFIGVYRTIS